MVCGRAILRISARCVLFILTALQPATAQTNKLWEPGTFSDPDGWQPNCSDCYVQQVETFVPKTQIPVSNPNPTCQTQPTLDFFELAQDAVRAYYGDPVASGNLIEAAKKVVYMELRNNVGGDFQRILDANGPRTPHGLCAPLAAMLPSSAIVVKAHLGVWDDSNGFGGCLPGQDCSTGWAKFVYGPEQLEGSPVVVATTFINWSHDRDRVGRLFVAYRIPPGKPKPVPVE